MADAGQPTVPVAQTLSLEQAADAFEFNQRGHVHRKIALPARADPA